MAQPLPKKSVMICNGKVKVDITDSATKFDIMQQALCLSHSETTIFINQLKIYEFDYKKYDNNAEDLVDKLVTSDRIIHCCQLVNAMNNEHRFIPCVWDTPIRDFWQYTWSGMAHETNVERNRPCSYENLKVVVKDLRWTLDARKALLKHGWDIAHVINDTQQQKKTKEQKEKEKKYGCWYTGCKKFDKERNKKDEWWKGCKHI